MATRYSKEKYSCIKGLKNEPLSNLAAYSKKRKLGEEKDETVALPSIQIASSSPTSSLEVTAFTSPTTRSKGKGKAGRSVWDDLTIALGHAHNVITDDELKGLLSISSNELVSRHIHRLVHICPFFLFCLLLYLFIHVYAHNFFFFFFLPGPWRVVVYNNRFTSAWRKRSWWSIQNWNLSKLKVQS